MTVLQQFSPGVGKPLFLGEFGAPKTLGAANEKALFTEILNAVESGKVPLSAFWVFDHQGQNKDWNVTFENERSYMLKLVGQANRRMKTNAAED